jgi:ATPase family AAA domain-containing protein 3A/B
MGKAYAIGLISALAASASASLSSQSYVAYADGPFKLSPFSSSSSSSEQSQPSNPPAAPAKDESSSPSKVRNDHPRTTSAGFDPEALERGAKALREITSSSQAKKVWDFAQEVFTIGFYISLWELLMVYLFIFYVLLWDMWFLCSF